MKRFVEKVLKPSERETLTEAYEVRAFRDESEEIREAEPVSPEILHAEQGAFQAIKSKIKGHGEQTVLPDDCQYGDNDLCSVES
jgi:hypothetical protein